MLSCILYFVSTGSFSANAYETGKLSTLSSAELYLNNGGFLFENINCI
jgi:hypothetical protein